LPILQDAQLRVEKDDSTGITDRSFCNDGDPDASAKVEQDQSNQ